jgi:hypothetical protein
LGLASPGVILIDRDAVGYGWFVDPTPGDDSEFAPGAVNSPARGRMDLLSVLDHEMGHELGFGDDDGNDVMGESLAAGVRRVPAAARAAVSTTADAPAPAIAAVASPQPANASASSATRSVMTPNGPQAASPAAPAVGSPATPIGPQAVSFDGIRRHPLVVGNLTHQASRVSPPFSGRRPLPTTHPVASHTNRVNHNMTDLQGDRLDGSLLHGLALEQLSSSGRRSGRGKRN